MKVFLICSAMILSGFTLMATQAPVQQSIHWDCVASPAGPKLTLDWSKNPLESLRAVVSEVAWPSTDHVPPVISTVIYTGASTAGQPADGARLTKTDGGPFTVTATDDVGIVNAVLYVDQKLVVTEASDPLPNTFYMRWNSKATAAGVHSFKLVAFDEAGNSTEKLWNMMR